MESTGRGTGGWVPSASHLVWLRLREGHGHREGRKWTKLREGHKNPEEVGAERVQQPHERWGGRTRG